MLDADELCQGMAVKARGRPAINDNYGRRTIAPSEPQAGAWGQSGRRLRPGRTLWPLSPSLRSGLGSLYAWHVHHSHPSG
jgi:hypothetical protein